MKLLNQLTDDQIVELLQQHRSGLILADPKDGTEFLVLEHPARFISHGWKLRGRMTINIRCVCIFDTNNNIERRIMLDRGETRHIEHNKRVVRPLEVGVETDCGITLAAPVVKMTARDGIQNGAASRALSMKPNKPKSKSRSKSTRKVTKVSRRLAKMIQGT